ncbi:MAG: bifunctional folylpolyglutamate synthase/dihydrofolate synthase [Firmicutes bacterium]|nr:bifunctional folylpolyglutamate synthase/dihydrofolate synthase [Bacillota bacterium]
MDIKEALEFLSTPKGWGGQLGLGRMRELLSLLGDPQERLRCVHVAGTNGKGSTSSMIASVLKAAGFKTGLFTSPHLIKWNERFKIDGTDISDGELCAVCEKVKAAADSMDDMPTVFERLTAVGFSWFADSGCDAAVIEVGLGGRFDSTNVLEDPAVCVIAHIALDHTSILGNTVELIAAEKAGIIKPGRPVVIMQQDPSPVKVMTDIAAERGSRCVLTFPEAMRPVYKGPDGQVFDYRGRKGVRLGLAADYQLSNCMLALDAIDELKRQGWSIPEDAVRKGLEEASWDARFQILSRDPLIILDGAHNPDGVEALSKALGSYFPGEKFIFMMGVMADKDYRHMIDMMAPLAEKFICVKPDSSRALGEEALAELIRAHGVEASSAADPFEGLDMALAELGFSYGADGKLIPPESASEGAAGQAAGAALAEAGRKKLCIFGSLYQAGDVLAKWKEIR